ncbi:thioredoxin domain-containing protein [Vibrio sp. D431a]|uniref:thioredoxin domain-containing protein n=1 Tax=Vibrio sp. D431a TaxID=2837388 RepID=UPI0025569513|nr:thioredoxin domain-containing protein [Vibrio sp. D431a]MDK9793258.1 thioredoxin domain-containing protein [Vibrio sp. D431a]
MLKKAIIGAVAVAIAIIAIIANEVINRSTDNPFDKVTTITEFKEGIHYSVIDTNKIKPYLDQLGINEGESFEIFSYTCPACFGFEPLVNAIDKKYSLNITQLQLGFEGLPLAEIDYLIKALHTGNDRKAAKIAVYNLMLDHAKTLEQKKAEVMNPINVLGVSENEITEEMKQKSKEYAEHTVALADALELQSTPSIYLGGKYLLHMAEIKSPNNLFRLIEELKSKEKI